MVELTAYEVLPRPALAPVPHWSGERIGYNLAITVAGFYGVAFMLSYLSEKLRGAREELGERQKALSRIQTLYANVIASMSSGLVTADSRERVTFLNQAGGDILGIVPARAVGKQLAEIGLVLPSDWGEIRQRTRGREGFRAEIDIERGASRRVIGYSVRALKDPDGQDAALIVFQDLTEVKKLERQARFNEQLAAVGELAAGIAHEIRNPLASISGSVQVLSHELSVGSAERRLMEIIVSESNRLSKILEEFLRFVRPQERRVARLRRRGEHPGGPGPLPAVGRGVRRPSHRGRRPSRRVAACRETGIRSGRSSTTSPRTPSARCPRAGRSRWRAARTGPGIASSSATPAGA